MAATKIFSQAQAVPERSTPQYTLRLLDADDAPIAEAVIEEVFLSLRDLIGNAIVNSRNGGSVYNTGGGTVSTGSFTMQFEEDDMQAVGSADYQPRLLTLDFRLTGDGRMTREVIFWVKSMQDIEA